MAVENPALLESRLLEQGWDIRGRWFASPLHPVITELDAFGYESGSAPTAEKLARTVINLPTHPWIQDDDARQLIELVLGEGAHPLT
jgi:dTDP-4-amino-4,6-dideoxygalactose transaminase